MRALQRFGAILVGGADYVPNHNPKGPPQRVRLTINDLTREDAALVPHRLTKPFSLIYENGQIGYESKGQGKVLRRDMRGFTEAFEDLIAKMSAPEPQDAFVSQKERIATLQRRVPVGEALPQRGLYYKLLKRYPNVELFERIPAYYGGLEKALKFFKNCLDDRVIPKA